MKLIKSLKRRIRLLPWWWQNWWRSFFVRRADLHCHLRTGIKPVLCDWAGWAVFVEIFVEGAYDTPIQETLASPGADGNVTVLDIGANVGMFTLRFCHLRRLYRPDVKARIHQFEACNPTFQRLQTQLAAQSFESEREDIRPHFGAVGQRCGTIRITANPFHAMTATHDEDFGGEEVQFMDLDQLLRDTRVIHLLKCDIEGGEKSLIEEYESLLRRTERMVIEFHLDRCNYADCIRRLQQCGLEREKIIDSNNHTSLEYYVNRETGKQAAVTGTGKLDPF